MRCTHEILHPFVQTCSFPSKNFRSARLWFAKTKCKFSSLRNLDTFFSRTHTEETIHKEIAKISSSLNSFLRFCELPTRTSGHTEKISLFCRYQSRSKLQHYHVDRCRKYTATSQMQIICIGSLRRQSQAHAVRWNQNCLLTSCSSCSGGGRRLLLSLLGTEWPVIAAGL